MINIYLFQQTVYVFLNCSNGIIRISAFFKTEQSRNNPVRNRANHIQEQVCIVVRNKPLWGDTFYSRLFDDTDRIQIDMRTECLAKADDFMLIN